MLKQSPFLPAVRSGGFYVVPISSVYIGLQVLYVLMMYISVYPVVITMRHSNVYEERSLGIYADDPKGPRDLEDTAGLQQHHSQQQQQPQSHGAMPAPPAASSSSFPSPPSAGYAAAADAPSSPRPNTSSGGGGGLFSRSETALELGRALQRTFVPWHGVGVPPPPPPSAGPAGDYSSESRISFITQQIHGQLAHDLWWLVLAVLVITTIETSHFLADPVSYSVFNVVFEVVSAYGCVGISVGLPYAAYSFCGSWHVLSKLILCLVMLRGRHRGLPVAIDKAVLLPGEEKDAAEEEDGRIRMDRMDRTFSRGRSVVGREGWSEPTMSGARSFVGREGWSEAV